jgi:hypothetical protein
MNAALLAKTGYRVVLVRVVDASGMLALLETMVSDAGNVTLWPSGLVIVTLRTPGTASPSTIRLTVSSVADSNVVLTTL